MYLYTVTYYCLIVLSFYAKYKYINCTCLNVYPNKNVYLFYLYNLSVIIITTGIGLHLFLLLIWHMWLMEVTHLQQVSKSSLTFVVLHTMNCVGTVICLLTYWSWWVSLYSTMLDYTYMHATLYIIFYTAWSAVETNPFCL